jgi:Tol biopolymer transport system component
MPQQRLLPRELHTVLRVPTCVVVAILVTAACGSNPTEPTAVPPGVIAFSSDRDSIGFQIYVMDTRTAQVTRLTNTTTANFSL